MSQRRHYSHAPITEALIDLRVSLPDGTGLQNLKSVHADIQDQYPLEATKNVAKGTIRLGTEGASTSAPETVGYVFTNEARTYVAQAQLDGFTLSRLAPYECWESFRDEARRLWNIYKLHVSPVRVQRLAVRYINRIVMPGHNIELKDYFRTTPEISTDISAPLIGLLMQLTLPQDDLNGFLKVTQTMDNLGGHLGVVLDIDLFTPHAQQDEGAIWDFFEVLHVRKNEVFEACITDKTRELIG